MDLSLKPHIDWKTKLYEKILYNYALHLLQLDQKKEPKEFSDKEMRDALRFADLLCKSNDPEKANNHKIWAQEIVALLQSLTDEDSEESAMIQFAKSYSPDVVILEPQRLVDEMKDWAKKVKKAYGG